MFMIKDMQKEIARLKEQNDICILAHCYQGHEILEVADHVGDSYALAKKAAEVKNKVVIMCGVRFMAETVKILAPEKTVILSNAGAGCPMAEQITVDELKKFKAENPNAAVVAYVNTTADLKTLCDVCVTSASALKIVREIPNDDILFVPDINLGTYIKNNVPQKNIRLMNGGCPYHKTATVEDVKAAKAAHPEAKLLVHPECNPEVTEGADYIGSTTGIMDYAKKSDAKEFIIGTENSIVEHLQFECPDKKFYPLTKNLVCHDMKLTTLGDVLECCRLEGGEVIEMSEEKRLAAKKCLDEMLRYGG
ncbi:MAG: quinolinate synthase NadA [Oscillospiraceae bacterium]|nr:quinolinate synthase NadA [Oscillospiraceae bacterium]